MVDMSGIMLMTLWELCKTCASLVGRPVILFYFILAQSGKILAHFCARLFYCKWADRLSLTRQCTTLFRWGGKRLYYNSLL